jgi:Uma2 family endonuclease
MRVHIEAANCFYYPDLSVTCDPDDTHDAYLTRPCFIVEVLSPSTARIDRREKRINYTTLESLCEYAMIDQNRLRIELFRREGAAWREFLLDRPQDVLESSCLGLRLTLEQIYEGVEFPALWVKEEAGVYDVLVPSYA